MEKNTTSFPGKERALGTRLRRFGSFLVSPTDGIRFKPFNSWIRHRIFAIALALHKLTSTFYVIITHTCNYDYSLGNFRKFQFNVSESNEPVRSKWPGEWDAFLKKNKNKACLNSPFFFSQFLAATKHMISQLRLNTNSGKFPPSNILLRPSVRTLHANLGFALHTFQNTVSSL